MRMAQPSTNFPKRCFLMTMSYGTNSNSVNPARLQPRISCGRATASILWCISRIWSREYRENGNLRPELKIDSKVGRKYCSIAFSTLLSKMTSQPSTHPFPIGRWQIPIPNEQFERELFERVYDRSLRQNFVAVREGNWWTWSVAENRERAIIAEAGEEVLQNGK